MQSDLVDGIEMFEIIEAVLHVPIDVGQVYLEPPESFQVSTRQSGTHQTAFQTNRY
jgi:hypothetical protein